MIRLALVDDHDLFREGIGSIIHRMTGIEIMVEASNGIELLRQLETTQVDVILMDLEMGEMDGVETTEIILEKYPGIRILILTMHDKDRMITYMMESGAHGYLIKNSSKEDLESAIREVSAKGYYFNDRISKALLSGLKKRKISRPTFSPTTNLSNRELEVLSLLCKEFNTSEIAEKLFISPRTVEGHRQSLLTKLDVKNTIGLVIKAIQEGVFIP